MVSIFKTLGEAVTKRPLMFIAAWILILIISIPLAGVFSSNLQYDTQKFIPQDLGSFVAKDKYDQQFPGNNTNQILVVVQSDDKTTAMHYIDALNASVINDSSIANVTGTSSIYSIQRDAVVNMTPDLFNTLYEAFDNTSNGSRDLYNATDTVRNSSNGLYWLWDNVTKTNDEFYKMRKTIADSSAQLYSARDQVVQGHDGLYQIKGIADMEFGIPLAYANAWSSTHQADPSLNDSQLDDSALSYVNSNVIPGVPSSNKPLAQGYLADFDGYWRTQSGIADPFARAQQTIGARANTFITTNVPPGQQQSMMLAVLGGLTLNSYGDASQLRSFCVNTAAGMQNITDPSQKQQLYTLYDLGQSPSSADIDNLVIGMAASQGGVDRGSIQDIYNLGRNPSDAAIGNYLVNKAVDSLKNSDSGKNMSASDLQNATDMIHDAWNIGPTATKQDFDSYVLQKAEKGLNATEKQTVEEIWGWGPDPNDSVIRSYILEQAGKDLNASENQISGGSIRPGQERRATTRSKATL